MQSGLNPIPALIGVAIIAAVAIGIITVAVVNKPIGANRGADAHGQCEQSEDFTCGAAASVSALYYVHYRTTERMMCAALHTHRNTLPNATDIRNGIIALYPKLQPLVQVCSYGNIPHDYSDPVLIMIYNDELKLHWICALHDPHGQWFVNDPAKSAPDMWTDKDIENAYAGVVVMVKP